MKTKIYTITNNESYNVAVGLHGLNTNATLDFNTYNTQINLNDLTTYFTTHNSQPQFGIWMQNATGSALRNNAVVWSGNSFITVDELSKLHGIRMQGSGSCVLHENTMTRFGGGIDIFDDCSKTQLECNTMDGCYHGVYFDINGPNNKLTDQGVAVFDPLYNAALSKTWHNHWINNVGPNKVDGQYFNAQFSWMYFDNPFDADYAPIPKPNYVIARPCSLNTHGRAYECE